MKILICFGDNDFGRELRAFGDLLVKMHQEGYGTGFGQKWRIVELFNESMFALHLMISGNSRAGSEKVRDYLRIKLEEVYAGQAAVDHMNNTQVMWNHSWLFVDLSPYNSTAVIV